ncbi:MAG: MHYT domain-containing protein [Roseibium sp.]
MTVTHEPWLVALSLIMAFQGSFVGLSLTVQLSGAADARRRQLLAGSAFTLALAIWSMHFVGMLAAQFQVAVDFLLLPTILSFLVCVLVVGIAVFAASNKRLSPLRLGLSAFVMGAGICTMHYLGMYALHTSLMMDHDPAYVFASFLIAFNASGLAMWLLFGLGKRPHILISAAVLALAISAMHYTAMTGLTFSPVQTANEFNAPSLAPGTLAILVSCVAFLVSGLFLLTLVPAQSDSSDKETPETSGLEPDIAPSPNHGDVADQSLTTDQNTHPKTAAGLQAVAAASPIRQAAAASRGTLPIECDGQKIQISIADIVAVHADAHYTKLFDGSREFFCPLSISEAEQKLDAKSFKRVHRSHIVNLYRVTSYKRSGDGGVLLLDGSEGQSVPVSRSRWSRVKSRLSEIADAADNSAPAAAQ